MEGEKKQTQPGLPFKEIEKLFLIGGEKMKKYLKPCMAIMFILVLMFSFSCAKKQVRDEGVAEPTRVGAEEEGIGEGKLEESDIDTTGFKEISESEEELVAVFKDIPFDFDDFSLKPQAKTILNGVAEWLLKNTSVQVLIEGHCDERGTNEYNLALGERRSNSAKKYLAQLGVSRKRIACISYGEEKPLDPGHNEDAWAKSRRDHFLIR